MRAVFSFVILMLFCCVVGAFAQSGRRIKPTPTPAEQISAGPKYSESVPKKKRARMTQTLRSGRGATPTKPATSADTTAEDDDAVVRVETSLITIPVTVLDEYGGYVTDLEEHNFTIFEDGKPQEIAYFGTSDKPFTVVLLIDTSPSNDFNIKDIRAAARAFVEQLKPDDNVAVVEFDANVNVLSKVTNDREKIYKAIGKADFGGGTSLYEAVNYSLEKVLNEITGRKAIVLFTDGVDTTSSRKITYDYTIDRAEESDTLIFPIYYNTFLQVQRDAASGGIAPPGTTAGEYAVGKKYLEDLAEYTGGRVFRAESTAGGLTRAFEAIAEELRRQYNIGYTPDEDGFPGQRKTIKVRVNRPGLLIRARDSYIVGENRDAADDAQ
jgi:VWFA-related protein